MTINRIAPALARGLNGYIAPLSARAVREARIRYHWHNFTRAREAAQARLVEEILAGMHIEA